MTKPKRRLSESKRPRREAGGTIRAFFFCPFCHRGDVLRVVAYRRTTVRCECTVCGGRFSFDALQVAYAMPKMAAKAGSDDAFLTWAAGTVATAVYVGALQATGRSPDEVRAVLAELGFPDDEQEAE